MTGCSGIEEMVGRLIAGDTQLFAPIFHGIGASPPEIVLVPSHGDIEPYRLASLYDYWAGLPRGPRLPLTEAIDALDIGPALGIVMLLEPVTDEPDFRFRLYGSEVAAASGLELTGKTLAAVPSAELSDFFRVTYLAALRLGAPLLTRHRPPPEYNVTAWTRLVLPCEDGDGTVDRLLVGNHPRLK